jgi:hypothetical protein
METFSPIFPQHARSSDVPDFGAELGLGVPGWGCKQDLHAAKKHAAKKHAAKKHAAKKHAAEERSAAWKAPYGGEVSRRWP